MWRLRIEQYFQVQDYALWDVIENGNSFKLVPQTITNADGTSITLIPGLVTTEEKVQNKIDVKARSMLLMALPNEHLITFNQYKDAQTLFAAIQIRFGGNEATKKTQKTLLKQIQLAILGENISQEDLNLKFLRSLPSEWNTHVVVWRNKPDLDTMSFDDLYNNFKIVEQEVKGTASSSSSSSSQNMAFVSSPSSTNEVNTAYGVSTANTQVSPASTQVSTASTQVSTANLSDDTVYAFLASQPNGSQLVYEDLEQIHEDDIEEMDLNDTAGYDKSKVECFNCHKMRHFARECRGPRNQDSKNRNQDSSRRTVNVEETSSKAMVAIDGAGLFSPPNLDLSYSGLEEFQQPEFEGYGPKTSKSVSEDISNEVRESPDAPLVKELVSDDKLEKKPVFPTVAKIEFVRPKQQEKPVRKLVKYAEMYSFDHVHANCNYHQRERVVSGNNYTRVNYNYSAKKAYPRAHRNIVPRAVLMKTGLRPLNTARPVTTTHPKTTVYSARPMPKAINTARLNSTVVNAVRENHVNVVKASACWVWRPTKLNTASITLKRHNYVDARGRSKHMTGNMSYLSDFKEFDEGYVTFRGGAKGGKITGKGNLKTSTEESIGAGHSSKEIGSNQDYIFMPLWKDGSLFDSSLKNASNDEPQPSSDAEKKHDEGVNKESRIDDQERPKNNTQDINTVGPSINTASTNVNTGSLNINTVSPTVTTAPLEARHADFFGDESEVDMSNITTTYPVPSTLKTRIHKDHSLNHVIGDVQSGMDVKCAFLYCKIEEEVYACQPLGFEDPELPDRVYKVEKTLYGLHQAPRAWYETFYTYLLDNGLQRGQIDKTLFIKRVKSDILLVQVYVDDIIFRSTKKELCTEFKKLMHKKFQISSIGELTFFLGLQVTQKDDGIFISQDKYVDEILKKFGFSTVKTASTPMETSKPLMKDENAKDADVHLYRLIIGSLMYLTSSRPNIMFVDSPFDLEAYTDSEYASASLDRKSTTGGCQFLGSRLISWQCKKQAIVANSTTEAEYVAVASCYSNEKKLFQMIKIHTDQNVADLLTKAFNVGGFQYLIASIRMLNL
ncbi:putative ribonuclease H-like domain-containing protein [Tanacetum coccineum]